MENKTKSPFLLRVILTFLIIMVGSNTFLLLKYSENLNFRNKEEFHTAVEEVFQNIQQKEVAQQTLSQEEQREQQLERIREANRLAQDVRRLEEQDHVYGKRDAQFLMFEYSDLECPFCRAFYPISKEFADAHEEVSLVFRHYPIDNLHPNARLLAEYSECVANVAGEDKFFEFVGNIFSGGNITSQEQLNNLMTSINLSPEIDEQAKTCLTNRETQERVEKDVKDGEALKITGTPQTILLNTETGKALAILGAVDLNALNYALEEVKKEGEFVIE